MKKSLRGQALYKSVCDYIKQYILDHDLKPGDPLPPEGQLVEDIGVGHSSVREAVKSLHTYQCPCVVVLPITGGNPDFLAWIDAETRTPED